MRNTLSVRRHHYQHQHGWLLVGRPTTLSHRRIRIFFAHESAARRSRLKFIKDPNYDFSMKDFLPVEEVNTNA